MQDTFANYSLDPRWLLAFMLSLNISVSSGFHVSLLTQSSPALFICRMISHFCMQLTLSLVSEISILLRIYAGQVSTKPTLMPFTRKCQMDLAVCPHPAISLTHIQPQFRDRRPPFLLIAPICPI
jgi:hypothetical protein